jgi:hypothetical protein
MTISDRPSPPPKPQPLPAPPNPGPDLQSQIDALVIEMMAMARTLQLPPDQTIGMLPAWCVRVMAKIPPGTVF